MAQNPVTQPPAASVVSAGSLAMRPLSARFAAPVVDVRDFCPPGHAFGTGSTQPLSSFFSTLGAAQAVFPFVTSRAQETDECAVQLALNTLYAAGGGIVMMPASLPFFNFQLVVNADRVRLWGAHPSVTIVNTGGCGTTPAIRVTGALGSGPGYSRQGYTKVLADFALSPNPGANLTPNATPGQPATGFVVGSSAILSENCFAFHYDNIVFSMYDETTKWGNNVWCATLNECVAADNNKGAVWAQQPTRYNSMENIRWTGGSYSNNNHNVYIDASTADGGATGGSFEITGISNDFHFVDALHIIGGDPGLGYIPNRVALFAGHYESTGAHSGTEPPFFFRNAHIDVHGPVCQWSDGASPRGIFTSDLNADAQYGTVRIFVLTQLGMAVPLGVPPASSGYNTFDIESYGSVNQNNTSVLLFRNSSGPVPQFAPPSTPTNKLLIFGDITAIPEWRDQTLTVLGTCTITLPVTGIFTTFGSTRFILGQSGITVTFAGADGNTLTVPPGKSLVFGGTGSVAGAEVIAVHAFGNWSLNGALS